MHPKWLEFEISMLLESHPPEIQAPGTPGVSQGTKILVTRFFSYHPQMMLFYGFYGWFYGWKTLKNAVNHILSDIFRENPWNPVYFRRQLFADIFCETKKYAIYFMRHLVIYFLRHQHIREDPFLNSPISTEQQEREHTGPVLFYRPIAESVWLCSAFLKRVHSEPIQLLLRPKSTIQVRFKQERLCVPLSFSCLFLVLMVCTARSATRKHKTIKALQ